MKDMLELGTIGPENVVGVFNGKIIKIMQVNI